MNISSEQPHVASGSRIPVGSGLEKDLSQVSHNLMGSISALLMCEHMLSRELAPTQELAGNEMLQTTLMLLKETSEQIRDHGEELMRVSRRLRHLGSDRPEVDC